MTKRFAHPVTQSSGRARFRTLTSSAIATASCILFTSKRWSVTHSRDWAVTEAGSLMPLLRHTLWVLCHRCLSPRSPSHGPPQPCTQSHTSQREYGLYCEWSCLLRRRLSSPPFPLFLSSCPSRQATRPLWKRSLGRVKRCNVFSKVFWHKPRVRLAPGENLVTKGVRLSSHLQGPPCLHPGGASSSFLIQAVGH